LKNINEANLLTTNRKKIDMNSVKEHETWSVIDSTKLDEYTRCPRRYFYKYMLGWNFEEPDIHLEFGTAWHLAMEHLLLNGYSKESVADAHALLTAHYRKFFPEIMDDIYYPKNPGMALQMLQQYVKSFPDDLRHSKVLYTETSGTVIVGQNRLMYFKTDSILQGNGIYQGKKYSREHKTTSRRGNHWSLRIQIGTYNHVLNCLFGPDDVYGVEVNEAIFQKTKPGFVRTQEMQSTKGMLNWMWQVNYWMDQIDNDTDRLLHCSESSDVMNAFPMNPNGCDKYGLCNFYDYCTIWSNPLQHLAQIPDGMTIKFWDPRVDLHSTTTINL
jgi:hypothetical protein